MCRGTASPVDGGRRNVKHPLVIAKHAKGVLDVKPASTMRAPVHFSSNKSPRPGAGFANSSSCCKRIFNVSRKALGINVGCQHHTKCPSVCDVSKELLFEDAYFGQKKQVLQVDMQHLQILREKRKQHQGTSSEEE